MIEVSDDPLKERLAVILDAKDEYMMQFDIRAFNEDYGKSMLALLRDQAARIKELEGQSGK
jgi:hypothetical protein